MQYLVRMIFVGIALPAMALPGYAQEQYTLDGGQWVQTKTYDPATPEGQLQAMHKLMARGKPKDAIKALDEWIATNKNSPALADAHLTRGDAYVAIEDYFKALFDYESVARLYPASSHFFTALEREYDIAVLFGLGGRDGRGIKRRLWGMRIVPAGGEAEELLIRIQERAPGSVIGEKAMIALGDYYYAHAEMTSAAEAYGLFLENYPESQFVQRAMLRLIQANLATFKGPNFDATGLIESAIRLKDYKKRFPAAAQRVGVDALLVRIDESLAAKLLATAQWYQERGNLVSAQYMYQRVVRDFSTTSAAQLALKGFETIEAQTRIPTAEELPAATDTEQLRQPAAEPAPAPATESQTQPDSGNDA